eukprot:XP_011423633.1 PREDICTED: uncharacterized protein LOC105325669 [Crassostrea gigas]
MMVKVSSLLVLIQLFMNIQVSRCVICTNNLGLEYHVERTSETHLTFSINACCPCRAQPIRYQLPMCGLVDVVEKINDITSETSGVRQSFASTIYGGNEICLQAQHSDIDVSYGNITSALLYSYQKLTEIALKFYIIEHHNSSRIGVTSGLTSNIGDTLCLLQSLLGDSEMPESVYRIRQSVTDMDISEMVPYTCRTLSQSITGLNSIAGSMRTTLLTTLNDFA